VLGQLPAFVEELVLEDQGLHAAQLVLAQRVPVAGHMLEDSADSGLLPLASQHDQLAPGPLTHHDRRRLMGHSPRRVLYKLELLVEGQLALGGEQVPKLVFEPAARQLHCTDLVQRALFHYL